MDIKAQKEWLRIGQVARRLDISVETIRMYERVGLFIPHRLDNGQRVYDEEDIHWLSCIRKLINEQGLNIEGVRRLLSLLPCWELKPCRSDSRESCPAYTGMFKKPCWMMKDELAIECQEADCRNCPVYRSAARCENLKVLLFRHNTERLPSGR